MFVRWKRQRRKDELRYTAERGVYREASSLLSASLVESYRKDGKPRQRTIAYLGSIRENHLTDTDSTTARARFWRDVAGRLEALNLPAADVVPIVAALEDRVPRVTPEEIEADRRRLEEATAAIRAGGR